MYSLSHHFPAKRTVRIKRNFSKWLIYQRLSPEIHKQMNQTLRKSSHGGFHSKLELQGFLQRNFNSQRTCVANSMVLTPIQPKIQASKVSEFAPSCTNKYAKEKNMTILTKNHGKVLATTSDYLLYNIPV